MTRDDALSLISTTEILIYCQIFNRMKGVSKMNEISRNILSSSFSIILGAETSWKEGIKSEEVIMVLDMIEIWF